VLGTTGDYFRYYQYSQKRQLEFLQGIAFDQLYEAVLGFEVAEKLGYAIGQEIIIAHGAGKTSFSLHKDKPFRVVGILKPTGTPLDRTVHVSLQGIEAIHQGWSKAAAPSSRLLQRFLKKPDLTPENITAFLVGLKSRIATFGLQREINEYQGEPLQAILPGITLQQLWDMMSVAENALLIVTAFVVAIGLVGMLTVMLAGLNERRREMAILRSVGARPLHVMLLITGESLLLTLLGLVAGLALLYGGLVLAQPYIQDVYGLYLSIGLPGSREWQLMGLIAVAGLLIGLIPGYRAYRYSLSDGLSIKI
jgi:putative ABC transport system permease protein